MGFRDFFSFCTSLKPIELRALGELSKVRHLEEGEELFHAGETADTLYIISRGVITVAPEDSDAGYGEVYFSRGDVIGVSKLITRSCYTETAHACESSSVQCVRSEHVEELARRVPAFGLYLAEQLAWRVLASHSERRTEQSACIDFGGNLRNFDIVSIVQTIYNSSKTGELSIENENQEAIAGLFFREGRPIAARYYHLTGEEAYWEIFLHERMQGQFNFTPTKEDEEVGVELPLNRGVDDMLINAVRQRDEFQLISEKLPPFSSRLRMINTLEGNEWRISPELLSVAQEICEIINTQSTRLEELFWRASFSELKLYQALEELMDVQIVAALSTQVDHHSYSVSA